MKLKFRVIDLDPKFSHDGSIFLVLRQREKSMYHLQFVIVPKGDVANKIQHGYSSRQPVWVKFNPDTLKLTYANMRISVLKADFFDLHLKFLAN